MTATDGFDMVGAVSRQPSPLMSATAVLFDGLVDDAAVFPPGSATLSDALSNHRCLRKSPASRHLGPLLVPASAVSALLHLVGDPAEPLNVAVIGTGGDPGGLLGAAQQLWSHAAITVVGLEIPLAGTSAETVLGTLRPAMDRHVPIALEVRRDPVDDVLAILEHLRLPEGDLVRAKYRTGGVGSSAVPDVTELSTFVATVVAAQLPAKFTAGLHHAVTAAGQHGVLNLMVAIHTAIAAPGQQVPEVPASRSPDAVDPALVELIATDLRRADPDELKTEISSWTVQQIGSVRRAFRSFGCCGVLEPLTEVAALGLIPPITHDLTALLPR